MVKNLPANAGDVGSVSGLGRSLGRGNGNPPQYSCLENSMDRGAGQAAAHGDVLFSVGMILPIWTVLSHHLAEALGSDESWRLRGKSEL